MFIFPFGLMLEQIRRRGSSPPPPGDAGSPIGLLLALTKAS